MGTPIATNIVRAGYPLTIWARRPEALEPLVAEGAKVAADLPTLARASDVIGICVMDDAGVREVIDRLRPGLSSGSTILIHSTVSPSTCRSLADELRPLGVHLLDVPVSGGVKERDEGRLTALVGGDADLLEELRPLISSFSDRIEHFGPHGMGQLMKILNNAVMAANLANAYDVVKIGTASGLDRGKLNRALESSSGRSAAHSMLAQMDDLEGYKRYVVNFRKDLGLFGEEYGDFPDAARIMGAGDRLLELLGDEDVQAGGSRPAHEPAAS
jgi:3-hydroxyisobutyrate dehydrogenase-like beta-hydroxyacid dehydrogenase